MVFSRIVFAALAIVMTTSAFYFLFAEPAQDAAAVESTARGSPIYLLLWVVLYAWSALFVGRDVLARGIARGALPLFAFSILVLVSMFWSVNAGRTMFYGIMLVANFIIGYALAVLFPPRQFIAILGMLLGALVAISLALLVVAPEYATSLRYGGAWLGERQFQGVFAHKSDAGYYLAALSLIVAHGRFGRPMPIVRTISFVAIVAAILLSNSATALIAAMLLNGCLVLANRAGSVGRLIVPTTAALAIVLSVVLPMVDIGNMAGLVGREASLTGRVPIWNAGFDFVSERPLLGYGYAGFFDLGTYSPVWKLWQIFTYFRTPHFHNSALDTLIGLGVVGLVGYVVLLAVALTAFANHSIRRHDRNLLGALLTLFVVSATFDFTFLKHNAFATTLLAYICIAAQCHYPAQLRSPAAEPSYVGA